MTTGSPPISMTSACAIGSTAAGAVTPNAQPLSRGRSRLSPVNVMDGWIASPMAPACRAGSRTSTPQRPAVWATSCPACQCPVAASPLTRSAS